MTKTARSKYELDFTNGSIIKKMLAFSLPLMATNLLQLLFNAADMIVVSLESDTAMGSIGATGSMTNLILQLFIGLGVGAGVITARCFGAKDEQYASQVLHTSMVLGLISGVIVAIFGSIFSEGILVLMDTPEENLTLATQYLAIYFLGSPFNIIYNFGASVMRSVGDTKRPLIYLTIAGVLNVIINLITVLAFHMGVVGVALATITSQAVSAVLVVASLLKSNDFIRLRVKQLKIHKRALLEILRIGVPSGIQGMVFALSNVIIQSAVNSFDSLYVNGNSAAANIEGFVYTTLNAASNSAVTASGQNYGAKRFDRIKKSIVQGFVFVLAVTIAVGGLVLLLFKPIVTLYVEDPTSQAVALERSLILITTYGLCGIMEVISGTLRGMGYSITPMLLVILGTCVVRIAWVSFVFPLIGTYSSIFAIYPISWAATAILLGVMIIFCLRKKQRDYEIERKLLDYMKNSDVA